MGGLIDFSVSVGFKHPGAPTVGGFGTSVRHEYNVVTGE